jgi:hypothetical protein
MAKKPTVKTSAMSNLLDSLTVTLGGNYPSQFVRTEVMRVVREALKLHNATEAERDELARRLAEAEARAEAAEAVVAKLPKTADGVPVVPGQTVFANWPHGPTVRCYAKHEAHGPDMVVFGEGSTVVNGLSCGIRVFVSDCYSTREAAEAAKESPRD